MEDGIKTKFELLKLYPQLKGLRCFDGNQPTTVCIGGSSRVVSLLRELTGKTKTADFAPTLLVALMLQATLHNLSLNGNKPVTIIGGNSETYHYNPLNNTIEEVLPE